MEISGTSPSVSPSSRDDEGLAQKRSFLRTLRDAIKDARKEDGPALGGSSRGVPSSGPIALFGRNDVSAQQLLPGQELPAGSGENSLRSRFSRLVPRSLQDLAPEGMLLPTDAGWNNRPTSDASKVAANRLGAAAAAASLTGDLKFVLFSHFLGGTGQTRELKKNDSNAIADTLTHSSSSFMNKHAEQIRSQIEKQIEATGQTSGSLRGVTDWTTTNAQEFQDSLGLFSAKLLYDVEYSRNPDGTINVSGEMSVAVQDLYDFGDEEFGTPIPANLVPADFRERPGFSTPEGFLTDRSLGALQRERLAKQFYVIGASDALSADMTLNPRRNASTWNVRR
jgi:type II secretory pathway pseudopilin PulG